MVNKFLQWYQKTKRIWFTIIYFIFATLIVALLVDKYHRAKDLLDRPVVETVSNDIDIETIHTKITVLQQDLERQKLLLEKQASQIKNLETINESLTNTNKQYEKRLLAHTEFLKRACEYFTVITVEKKILPRQCLPDYQWRREEGM
jgi:hypothetical protein